MSQNDPSPSNWREELKQLGKSYFEVQDMIRLGFLKINVNDIAYLKSNLAELNKINARLRSLKKELEGLEDITPLIKEIRKNRIERVRAQRAIRKAEKAKIQAQRQAEIAEKKKNTPSYLGEKLAQGLIYEGEDIQKLNELSLPLIKDIKDLADAIQMSREEILWLSYHRQTASIDHYNRFQIPKRKGGTRTIASPKPKMRQAQQWILERILSKVPIHEKALAFREGMSIRDNATLHLHQGLLIRIDLKDFFPSIAFPRVKGLFKFFGYSPGIASILALLCTDAARIGATLDEKRFFVALGQRYLPQGACTSPYISNLVCRRLDNRLNKLALSMGWVYSRYADDMVFSHPDKEVTIASLLGLSQKIISDENFEINREKTMVMRPHQRQSVTGVVVNGDQLRVSRRDMRRFRAFLHQYALKGAEAISQEMGRNATQYGQGYWAFIKMINPGQAEKILLQNEWLKN